MKSHSFFVFAVAGVLAAFLPASRIESQVVAPVDPLTTIQALQTTNDDLLKRQEATLKDLSDMTDTAREVRILTKRG